MNPLKYIGAFAVFSFLSLSCTTKNPADHKVVSSLNQKLRKLQSENAELENSLKNQEQELHTYKTLLKKRKNIIRKTAAIETKKNRKKEWSLSKKPLETKKIATKKITIKKKIISSERKKFLQQKASYAKKIKQAKDYYHDNRYDKAFLAFSDIEREFSSFLSKGEPLYWIGRCWFKLEEYKNSKIFLNRFLALHPESKWTVPAKIYLAKAELKSGNKKEGAKLLKEVLKEIPKADKTIAKHLTSIKREAL